MSSLPGAPEVTPDWLAHATRAELKAAFKAYADATRYLPDERWVKHCAEAAMLIQIEQAKRQNGGGA